MNAKKIKKVWKPRKKDAHKGDFGRVFILAGSEGYTGAAYLTSMAALRSGAGLVILGVPKTVYSILAKRHAEVMVKAFASTKKGSFSVKATKPALDFFQSQDVLAIGPGLSTHSETQRFARKMISESTVPIVIDADGLNALKGNLKVLKECLHRVVLTPHPKEFTRLFGGKLTADSKLRKKRALEVAQKYKAVVLLKGHQTVIADPSGQVVVNRTGNPGMATGGSGDILTGMIAALIGQKMSLLDSAAIGAHLHGLAGDLAAKKIGQISLIAGDLLDFLPQAIKKTLRF